MGQRIKIGEWRFLKHHVDKIDISVLILFISPHHKLGRWRQKVPRYSPRKVDVAQAE